MKIAIIGIVLALFVLISFQSSFAYTVTYEKWDARILDTPTVCIIEPDYPNSEILTESFSDRILDETRISINEWMVLLQISERGRDKSMWEINQIPIQLEDQKDFDYEKCTVFIEFKEKPESKDDYYKLLGKTSYELGNSERSTITVYYKAIELCKTEDSKWIYFDPCYKNYPRLMQQIQSVIKHEFGHSLGLGHFLADELDVNVAWARGDVPAPSIMAVFTHQNINNNFITTKDVEAVRSIYGDTGFFPKQEDEVFEYFQPASFVYGLPRGEFVVASVDGLISKSQYVSGVSVEITITDPNNSTTTKKVFPNSKGAFSYQTIVSDQTTTGNYQVYAKFRGVASPEVSYFVSSNLENEQSKFPQWVKNSVKWWAEDKISDHDFLLGIQYLVREGILNPPTREDQKSFENQIDLAWQIPKYVKQTSIWWIEGIIPDDQFIGGIQYLIKKGILVF